MRGGSKNYPAGSCGVVTADPQERDVLESLTQGAGWIWLHQWYDAHWGDAAMTQKYERIIASALDPATQQQQMGQAKVARDAVRGLLHAPLARIEELAARVEKAAQGPVSRRGPSL
jgi:hypothetical protein